MAVAYNPSIVTNGLVLALDAGNNKSHSTNRFISYGSGLVTENVTFSIQGTGTFQRVAAGTVIGGYTVKATDVVYSYALGTTGCHYHGNSIPIPAGVSATFSFDYLVTGATTYPITDYLANFESALGGAITTANTTQNIWQRRTLTAGPTGAAGTLNAYLYPGNCANGRLADSGTIYYRNPKVEFTSVDTGDGNFSSMANLTTWTNLASASNNGTLTNTPYHLINSNGSGGYMSFDGTDDYVNCGTFFNYSNFTISLWVYPGSTQVQYADIFDNNHAGTQNFVCQQNASNTNQYAFGCLNATNASSTSNFTLTANTWHHLTFTWNNSVASAYINGVFNSSGAAANAINYVSPNLSIARWSAGGRNWNGRISNFVAYDRVLSLAEIQQNFNATRGRFGI